MAASAVISRRALLAAAAAAPVAGLVGPSRAAAADDAVWIWETPAAEWREAADFAARLGFRVVFLSIPPADRGGFFRDPTALDRALAPYVAAGLTVWLAAGDPKWALAERTPEPLAGLTRLTSASATLAGLYLDVEPHVLPAWKNRDAVARARLAAGTAALLRRTRKELSAAKALGCVLHPSFAGTVFDDPGKGSVDMAAALLAAADEVALMAYRNTPQATAAFAAKLLDRLDAQPKPWRFGLTVSGGQTQENISYDKAGWPQMRADMAALATMAQGRAAGPWFKGGVVNAYRPLRAMVER